MRYSSFIRGVAAGMVGGLAGTVEMYFFGLSIFMLMGWPANMNFVIIGDSAAAFFSKLNVALVGGPSLGVLLYIQIGLALGAIMGVALAGLKALHLASPKKKVGLCVLYVEVMSLPLLAAGTIALKMNASAALLWFGISFIMHLVYGLVLGTVTSYGVGATILRGMADPPGGSRTRIDRWILNK